MRIAVIGAGISGLAAAWYLRQKLGDGADIVVLEKKDYVGGHLRASEVAGLPVDEAAESLLARRPEAVDLVNAVGLGADVRHPATVRAQLWSRGRLHRLPHATVMGVPSDPSQLVDLLTTDERGALDRDAAPGMPIDTDVAIGQLVRERLGAAVVDRLVDPLLGGVYAGRADELSLDATVPALGAAARKESSLFAAARSLQRPSSDSPVFAGIDGGVGRLPVAVAAAARADVRTSTTVRELHRTTTGWRLVTGPVPAPEVMEVDAVVLAVPATPAARLLRGIAESAATELAGVETASMAIVTLAVPSSALVRVPDSSGFLVPAIEGRAVKAVTYSSVKWPWLADRAGDLIVMRASVGRRGEVAVLQRDDDELVDVVRRDLAEMAGLTGTPVDTRVSRWGGALPQYAVGHRDKVRRILDAVGTVPGLAVCGAVFDGVGIAACIASARDAATDVVNHVKSESASRPA